MQRVALVTGSTSGIGLGVAKQLVARGTVSHIMLNGFGDPEHALAEVRGAGLAQQVGYCDADLKTADGVEFLMKETARQFGPIDILVNNAGVQHVAPIEDFPLEQWDRVMAINCSAAFYASRLALPHMKAQKWGRIINIASVHGLVASSGKAAYVTAKHGIMGLTKTLGVECAPFGVAASAICPGWVRTPLVEAQIAARAAKSGKSIDEETELLIGEKMPSKQFVEVSELGDTVVFLCSDAARQINGSAIIMDGGWTSV